MKKTRHVFDLTTFFVVNCGFFVHCVILQHTVALSSAEAEFYALSEAGKLTLYVRSILHELGIAENEATSI